MQAHLAGWKYRMGGMAALQYCLSKQTDPNDEATIWLLSQRDNMLKFDGENAVKKCSGRR